MVNRSFETYLLALHRPKSSQEDHIWKSYEACLQGIKIYSYVSPKPLVLTSLSKKVGPLDLWTLGIYARVKYSRLINDVIHPPPPKQCLQFMYGWQKRARHNWIKSRMCNKCQHLEFCYFSSQLSKANICQVLISLFCLFLSNSAQSFYKVTLSGTHMLSLGKVFNRQNECYM